MKRLILLCSMFALVSMLTGCGPVYQTDYEFVAPKSTAGKVCHAQCVQNQATCNERCRVETQACRDRAKQDALYEYEQYKFHQKKANLPIEKDISAFNHGGSCGNSCNCEPVYKDCFKACGGKVIPHTRCVAFCDKEPGYKAKK